MCLAPSHLKHKNDQFSMQDILYGVYTLSMPVLSLKYTYDIQCIYKSYTEHIHSI
jgi:hypothetical protein